MSSETRPIPFMTSFAVPILLLLGTMLVALGLVSWRMADRLDVQALAADVTRVEQSLDSELNDFIVRTQDHATWTEMVDHVVRAEDMAWVNRALGPELNKLSGLTSNMVVRADGSAVYAAEKQRMVGGDGSYLAGDVHRKLMEELNAQPDGREKAVGHIARVDNMVTLVAGMRIRPEDKIVPANLARRYFIVTKRIDPAYVALMAKDHYISGLRLVTPDVTTPSGMERIAVRDWRGRTIAQAQWTADRPGTDILRRYAPGLGLVVLLAIAMAAWVLSRAWRAVVQLDDNWRSAAAMARLDDLTGLYNRRALSERFDSRRAQALFIIDLNHFKHANDTHGHAAGDEILRLTSGRLTAIVPLGDEVYRLGGDEFAVLSMSCIDDAGAARLAEAIVAAIAEPMPYVAIQLDVTASVGIAMAQSGESLDRLLHRADLAMYMAKQTSRADRVAAEAAPAATPPREATRRRRSA